MSNHQKIAIGTLRHYLETAYQAAGLTWEYDNTSEVENIVDAIVSAAVDEVDRRQPQRDPDRPTGPTLAYVRELEAAVSEAADILKSLIEMDDTGLAFVSPADGKVLERAVKFLAAASEDSES